MAFVGANQSLLNMGKAITPVRINQTISLNANTDEVSFDSDSKPILYVAIMPVGADITFVVEEGPFEGADDKSFQEISSGSIVGGASSVVTADSAGGVVRIKVTSAGASEVLIQGKIH